jgi:hypothetical protein
MNDAGFSRAEYRNSGSDLKAALPSDEWSPVHYLEFIEHGEIFLRIFPLRIDFKGLQRIANLHLLNRASRASLSRALLKSQIDYDPSVAYEEDFWTRVFEVTQDVASLIVFLGDSHSKIFRQIVRDGKRVFLPLNFLCGGGSAIALSNKSSRSGYGVRIEKIITALMRAQSRAGLEVPVCVKFGAACCSSRVYQKRNFSEKKASSRQSGRRCVSRRKILCSTTGFAGFLR